MSAKCWIIIPIPNPGKSNFTKYSIEGEDRLERPVFVSIPKNTTSET